MTLWLEKQLKKKGFDVEIDLEPEFEDYGTETQFRAVLSVDKKQKLNRIKTEAKIILKQMRMVSGSKENESKTDKDN